ncbi:MAG: hypothetical protein ACYDDF_05025 [Thermoplasmatota archaeon]
MTLEPENRWLRFGLETNPYFVEALRSDEKGPRPITLFQGREAQTKELVDTIAAEQSSLNVVEAPAGAGKSSFVNHAKYLLRRRYFAPPVEVGVQSNSTAQSILVSVIDAVVRHASDLDPDAKWEKKFPAIAKARALVQSIQSVAWDVTAGGSVPTGLGATLGIGRQTSVQPPFIGTVLSPAFLDDLTSDLLQLADPPYQGVIFHINNMDTILTDNAPGARTMLGDLRDHFQVTHTHWIFLGPPGLREDAFAPERRVLSNLKAWVGLDRLPLSDVDKMLTRRYEHYAFKKGEYTKPTENAVVKLLYEKFGGDLRGLLNALTTAHKFYNPIDIAPMSADFGRDVLARHYLTHLEKSLSPKTLDVLRQLAKQGQAEFGQDDARSVEKDQANRSRRFGELEQWDAIRLVRRDGAKKIYTFGGAARLAFAM